MNDDFDFIDEDFKEMESQSYAQAWVRKIDRAHCAVTLGDDDLDSRKVQARLAAMDAAARAVELLCRDPRNILNENNAVQILFCVTYLVTHRIRR